MYAEFVGTLTIMSFHASEWPCAARALLRSYGVASGHVGPKSFPRCRSPPPSSRSLVNHQPKRRSIWLLSICGTVARFYTSDCFREVSDEVAEMFKEFDRKEADYRLRTYRHKAYYSLDRDDGLEHEAVHKPARISLPLIKNECMVYIEPFYGGYYVWRLTAKSKQAECYVFIDQKVGCASQLDGETIPSAYRRLVPSNRGDVYVYSWHLNCTMWDVVN